MMDKPTLLHHSLRSPYPYFGGKSRVAPTVWRSLGDVPNLVIPFFGSGAELLARPSDHSGGTETVNDLDGNVANFWRAVQANPDELAEVLSYPVNECDLEARHKALVRVCGVPACKTGEMPCDNEECVWERIRRLRDDPEYFHLKYAGWWCWGLCCWIGSGWCTGEWWGQGDENNAGCGINVQDEVRGGKRPHLGDAGMGVHRKLTHLGGGRGVHRQLPHLGAGMGVHRQLPHLGDAGRGVHRQLPHLGGGRGGECAEKLSAIKTYMHQLCDRLRNVRVCCGDWTRVMGPMVTFKHGLTGIILDPPYSAEADRCSEIYSEESLTVANDVRAWCRENGDNPLLRIALCGYEGEHDELESIGWTVHEWKANGGYGTLIGSGKYTNKYRERVWFSPACLRLQKQRQLEFA